HARARRQRVSWSLSTEEAGSALTGAQGQSVLSAWVRQQSIHRRCYRRRRLIRDVAHGIAALLGERTDCIRNDRRTAAHGLEHGQAEPLVTTRLQIGATPL